ncbi:MAG TPA: hypothetical protein VJV79_15020 [Polyangiaceae bacterium]|nr:hypothetical protein [Polyangiaceae bacterium]
MSRKLSDELSYREDGHASDLVLSALVDGQDSLVPAELSEHVDGCPFCSDRLGDLAALSFSVGEALSSLESQSSMAPARLAVPSVEPRPLPAIPFALGLLVAAMSSLPRLLGDGRVSERLLGLEHGGLSLWRTARLFLPVVVERERVFFVAVCLTTTLLAGIGGWLLARNVELSKEPLA